MKRYIVSALLSFFLNAWLTGDCRAQLIYDRDAAVAYSTAWCGARRNPNYIIWNRMPPWGPDARGRYHPNTDCANYASQVAIAGGRTMGGTRTGEILGNTIFRAADFQKFLEGYGGLSLHHCILH